MVSDPSHAHKHKLPKDAGSSTEYDSSDSELPEKIQINRTKKLKAQDKILQEDWITISRIISQNKEYPLTTLQIKDFFTKSCSNKYPVKLALQFTDNLPSLQKMLTDLHPHLSSSLKNRTTRITGVLEEYLTANTEMNDNQMETETQK